MPDLRLAHEQPCPARRSTGGSCICGAAARDVEAQAELAGRLIQDGSVIEDPDEYRCRTCRAIYDGGMRCTYCGDADPLDDGEEDLDELNFDEDHDMPDTFDDLMREDPA